MKQFAFLLLLTAGCASCSKVDAPDFVPGQKMVFPTQSAGVLNYIGQKMLINCKSDNADIQEACLAKFEQRIATCNVSEPSVFKTKSQYKGYARDYLKCVMPKPVCRGVEVTSLDQCKRTAKI
jgi:hypothetical protein